MQKIKIDYDKCTGCRHCETACSLHHIENTINPQKSRIRVFVEGDSFFPVIAGPFTDTECTVKGIVVIDGKEYDECALCRASCPAKPIFKEPDTGVPLKCDFCRACVKWCASGALTLIEV